MILSGFFVYTTAEMGMVGPTIDNINNNINK